MADLKIRLRNFYFKMIDYLHRPLVRRGAEDPYHVIFRDFISLTQQAASPSILEIGSRNVTGTQLRDQFAHCKE
jgi:hypothetical protein